MTHQYVLATLFMLISISQSHNWNKPHINWDKLKSHYNNKAQNWKSLHNPKSGGFKQFESQFVKHKNDMKKFFMNNHKGMKHLICKKMCDQFPKMPFSHRPMYPFMHKPMPFPHKPVSTSPFMNHVIPHKPLPQGYTEVHFFGQYQNVSHKTLLLGNGQAVPVTMIKSISVEIDFRIDNKLLSRMRNQFARYHKKWMFVLGGILGGFKGMMPYLKHAFKRKSFKGMNRFPKVLNKLVRLHEMITRHNGLMAMLQDAEANEQKVKMLQQKLDLMKKSFDELEEKLKFMNEVKKQDDKKLGRVGLKGN